MSAPELLSSTSRGVLEDVVAAGGSTAVSAVSLIELVYVAEKRSDSIDAETLGLVLDVVEEPSSPISLSALSVDVAGRWSRFRVFMSGTRSIGRSSRRRGLRACGW